jgi:prephenate dehydrogenase
MNAPWPTVAIVGVGLIGGSIGRAVLARRLARRVIGIGRSDAGLAEARAAGAVTDTSRDVAAAAAADLVVVATGVAAIPRMLEAVDAAVRPATLVTDAGSTKGSIVAGWERRRDRRRARFVGGHPLAGSHRRGAGASDPELFVGRIAVVTPAPRTPPADVEAAAMFWSALGSTVYTMPPREHDKLLAASSHAPHVVAAALAAATPAAARRFTAGGWRDTTRIAAADPELWADILLDNGPQVAAAVARVTAAADRLVAAITAGDRRRLVGLLARGREAREAVTRDGIETDEAAGPAGPERRP